MARLRKSCMSSKGENRCKYYSLVLMSCTQYRDKEDCELLKRVKVNHRKGAASNGNDLFRQ